MGLYFWCYELELVILKLWTIKLITFELRGSLGIPRPAPSTKIFSAPQIKIDFSFFSHDIGHTGKIDDQNVLILSWNICSKTPFSFCVLWLTHWLFSMSVKRISFRKAISSLWNQFYTKFNELSLEKTAYQNCTLQKHCSAKFPESGKIIKEVRNSEKVDALKRHILGFLAEHTLKLT